MRAKTLTQRVVRRRSRGLRVHNGCPRGRYQPPGGAELLRFTDRDSVPNSHCSSVFGTLRSAGYRDAAFDRDARVHRDARIATARGNDGADGSADARSAPRDANPGPGDPARCGRVLQPRRLP